MRLPGLSVRALAALAALTACTGEPGMIGEAAATTPPLTWQQVRAVRLLCLVTPDVTPRRQQLQTEICETVRALAADGAPMPVEIAGFGDPAVLEPDTATLLVHAAFQGEGDQRLLVFHLRTFRAGRVDTEILFGAAPRAVPIGSSDPVGPAFKTALAAALADTLPWRHGR